MKKSNKILIIILLIIAFGLLCYSSYMLYKSYSEYKEIDDTYNQIVEDYVEITEDTTGDVSEANTADNISINWCELQKINKDIIAWIRIPDTNINYPIVQGTSNTEYLHQNIYKKYSKGGSIFVDSYIKNPFSNFNTIVYGHNLNNGSMFSYIKKYKNEEYAKEHNVIYIYFPDGRIQQYKVFAFGEVDADNYDIYNVSVDNLQEYYEVIKGYNTYDINDYDSTKPILTLSTCTNKNKNKRYVLHAYLFDC